MTEAEIKAVADEMAARAQAAVDATKASRAAMFAKAKAFVIHNALGLAVGAGAALAVVKFL